MKLRYMIALAGLVSTTIFAAQPAPTGPHITEFSSVSFVQLDLKTGSVNVLGPGETSTVGYAVTSGGNMNSAYFDKNNDICLKMAMAAYVSGKSFHLIYAGADSKTLDTCGLGTTSSVRVQGSQAP